MVVVLSMTLTDNLTMKIHQFGTLILIMTISIVILLKAVLITMLFLIQKVQNVVI
ncbi:hypothetical protein [Ornithinibacillus salinisoli]|uniref:hypothetical protein n=1 Tax=Ornithinibacillus salinisoli TaxID=1848459 RepID=UPI00366B7697